LSYWHKESTEKQNTKGLKKMNSHILENAAVYANAYRSNTKYGPHCEKTLRNHIATRFGAVYAAILCR
jgi:hypothetical protein